MPAATDVSRHYTHGSLADAIRDGLASLGKAPGTATVDDFAPVDEFHIGGRKTSEDFLDQLNFRADQHAVTLVTGAFREMKADDKIGRSEALRRSMLALINGGGRSAHPTSWAPFVVVGEGAR